MDPSTWNICDLLFTASHRNGRKIRDVVGLLGVGGGAGGGQRICWLLPPKLLIRGGGGLAPLVPICICITVYLQVHEEGFSFKNSYKMDVYFWDYFIPENPIKYMWKGFPSKTVTKWMDVWDYFRPMANLSTKYFILCKVYK